MFGEMEKKNKIFAVVISFNPDIHLLNAEYFSICNQVDGIFYIDNNSKNKSDILQWSKDKPKANFEWLNSNEGIGFAQNIGIRKALKEKASHVIIFDQDSIVDDSFVSSLLFTEQEAIRDGYNVGLTGPIYYSSDGNYPYPVLKIENDKIWRIPLDSFDNYIQTTHIIASGELIRTEVLQNVGLMRENLFIGYIDFEYCFRARKFGYDIVVSKKAVMRHQMGDKQIDILGRKIGIYSPFRRYFDCRNTLLIQNDGIFPKALRRYYLKLLCGKILVSLIYGPHRFQQLRYCLRGLIDGINGISGKCSIVSK